MFSKVSQLWRGLLCYVRRDRFDRELEEEMRFHLEMKTVMGIAPIVGRNFSPKDSELGEDLAVLSYGYWQSRFGGLPDVLGKSLSFDCI